MIRICPKCGNLMFYIALDDAMQCEKCFYKEYLIWEEDDEEDEDDE